MLLRAPHGLLPLGLQIGRRLDFHALVPFPHDLVVPGLFHHGGSLKQTARPLVGIVEHLFGKKIAVRQKLGGLPFHAHPLVDHVAVHVDERQAVRRGAQHAKKRVAVVGLLRIVNGHAGGKHRGRGRGRSGHAQRERQRKRAALQSVHTLLPFVIGALCPGTPPLFLHGDIHFCARDMPVRDIFHNSSAIAISAPFASKFFVEISRISMIVQVIP